MNKKTYIAYYRVSTPRQGKSGLGLGAQRKDVERFLGNDKTSVSEISRY